MFHTQSQIGPARLMEILKAAESAARAIPPAFPLEATVAVNPFLGQTGEDLATAAARLERVAGVSILQQRSEYAAKIHDGRISDEDLTDALSAYAYKAKPATIEALKTFATAPDAADQSLPLPTVADLAAQATGIDWPSVIEKTFGLWAAGQFDRGQALWSPAPGGEAFAAWRAWATHDLTPEIAGLSGFCAHVAQAPDTPERAILRAAGALGLSEAAAETAFHRLYMDLGGWSQHARWLLWQAELAGESNQTLADMLAIRLIWEEVLLAHIPGIAETWQETVAAHAAPVVPSDSQIALAILQDAADRAHQRRLIADLHGASDAKPRPALQAAFCIDVRSEVFRRALESVDSNIETIGFAGFFGLPIAHKAHGSDVVEAHLPVLLNPAMETTGHAEAASEDKVRIAARTMRAWGRFRQAAVSSFAFVEAAGPLYGWKLVRDALGKGGEAPQPDPLPQVVGGMSAEAKAGTAAAVLKAMSLTEEHGRVVLLLGQAGRPPTIRMTAPIIAAPAVATPAKCRHVCMPSCSTIPTPVRGLPAAASMCLKTRCLSRAFTTPPPTRSPSMMMACPRAGPGNSGRCAGGWMLRQGSRGPSGRLNCPAQRPTPSLRGRSTGRRVRPEWGLAGCAAFIAAPRRATSGKDLGGRAFLHSYDWRADEGFGTLELIITAPVVVASWISLQYYGSSVAPEVFGGGNKLIHNVVGGIGVIEGNSGRLRPGLPWQTVHDGERLMHEPLRLSVMIEAPREAILDVLERHPGVRALFDNGWLHLFALKDGKVDGRYQPGPSWTAEGPADLAA